MQNMDFYDGKHMRDISPQFDRMDPEYFSRTSPGPEREPQCNEKRAVRILTVIAALVIMAFTTGLVVGIKFAGGADKKLVDDQTFNAVNNFGQKVSNLVKDINITNKPADKLYPKKDYPYVIKLDNKFRQSDFKSVASYLSSKGHTVIVSKSDKNNYRLYTGPYKTEDEAKQNLSKLSAYKEYALHDQARIIKRI